MSYQQVKYKLINNDTLKTLEVGADPKNWDSSDKTLKRSTKSYGVYTELSKNLEFTKDAAAFLLEAINFKDIEADVTLEEWRVHPKTEEWYLHSTGVFDFSDYEYNKHIFKAPFKTGGLNAKIQAQLKEKFELERLEALNGNTINELTKKDVSLTSREIFLLSKLKENKSTLRIHSGNQFTENGKKHRKSFPLEVVSNSDQENVNSPIPTPPDLEASTGATANTSDLFYIDADVDHLNVSLQIDLSFKISNSSYETGSITDKDLHVRLKRYNNSTSFDFVENIISPISITDNVLTHLGETFTYSGVTNVDILTGESLSLVLEMEADYVNGVLVLDFEDIECSIKIAEDSIREDSSTKAVLFHDVGDKLTQIITGEQGQFYSEFYGTTDLGYEVDGDYAYTAATLGLWIRQFFDKKIEWSIGGFLETSNAIHNTGYNIEIRDNKETLVVEDLKYFFPDEVTIILPNQVSDVERKAANDFYYASMEFGYKEGGDYEEAMGLDEYNVKNSYTNPITRVDKKLSKLSEARADSYAKEFARRKPQLNYPEEDTRYDKDIHLLDLKTGLGNALLERTWSDDYEIAPTGVYSPDTATNLRLTPYRNSERHQWVYGSGLVKHPNEKVRYSNSEGNSTLVTKKENETARAENGDILISELKKPRFTNQWITFNHEVDYYINEQLYGKTDINGRQTPNYYGKVEFINEYGLKEYGYLFECKPNGKGSWKLLKSL